MKSYRKVASCAMSDNKYQIMKKIVVISKNEFSNALKIILNYIVIIMQSLCSW